jgi:hypothetical protein
MASMPKQNQGTLGIQELIVCPSINIPISFITLPRCYLHYYKMRPHKACHDPAINAKQSDTLTKNIKSKEKKRNEREMRIINTSF